MMRWIIGCLCCLLLPAAAAAKCHFDPSGNLRCAGQGDLANRFLLEEELYGLFLPPDKLDKPHWMVERPKEESPKFHLPELYLGSTRVSYHRHEVSLTQDCWRLSFHGFKKIELYCRSSF